MMKIQQVHQKIHAKQFSIILYKLFSIGDSFEFKATRETRLILVTYQRDSCENVNEFILMSPHVMPHPIVSQITNANQNVNASTKREAKNEHDCRKMFASQ